MVSHRRPVPIMPRWPTVDRFDPGADWAENRGEKTREFASSQIQDSVKIRDLHEFMNL
jgi:hypothetical protein